MPKSSKIAPTVPWGRLSLKDPRIAMRAVIGLLLLANLVVAVIAFKPFGGSADDLRKDQAGLSAQLRQMNSTVTSTRDHVAKIQIARTQGDEFLAEYIMEKRSAPEITVEEMTKAATDAGIRALPENAGYEPIEGSDTIQMMSITAGFEGSYAGLTKLVNALEKWPRFLIIDSMNLNAPQQQNAPQGPQQNLNVTLKLLTFVRDDTGALP
jgi:Type II secretion system (T2SS), protein M subtype b